MTKTRLSMWLVAVLMLLPFGLKAQENQGGNGIDDAMQVWQLFSGDNGYGMRLFSLGDINHEEDNVDWQDVEDRVEIWNIDFEDRAITIFRQHANSESYGIEFGFEDNITFVGNTHTFNTNNGPIEAPVNDIEFIILSFYSDSGWVVLSDGNKCYWLRPSVKQEWDQVFD